MPSPIYERRAREARTLLNQGLSRKAAAEAVGLSIYTLNRYLKNKGPAAEKFAPPLCSASDMLRSMGEIETAKKLRELRFSYFMISKFLQLTPSSVYRWRDLGVFEEVEKVYQEQRKITPE